MSNLKPNFGPKVCLASPCQAFNPRLGQNACFELPHVKLGTQIRAKGLSSPTMPSLRLYWGKTLVLRSRLSNLKPNSGPKVCLAPPCQAFNLTLGQNACFALPHVKIETQIQAKGLSSPTMPNLQPYTLSKTLVLRSRMSNLKPKFGPKVCLAPPCQAFNLTLWQNACFALPHVKLEAQIRAKGLSSPTMPSLQPFIGAKRSFCAPACQT